MPCRRLDTLDSLALNLLFAVSCGQNSVLQEPDQVVERAEPPAIKEPEPSLFSVENVPAPASAIPALPRYSIENMIYRSDLIARVDLAGVELAYRQDGDLHYAELEYEFVVLEYLKGGSGSQRIWGIVSLPYAAGTDEQEVRAIAVEYMQDRETRWDGDEAIIFMRDVAPGVPSTHVGDYYFLGWFAGSIDDYSLVKARRWLPLSAGSQRSGDARQFILGRSDVESHSKSASRRGPTPQPNQPKDPLIPDGPLISLTQLNGLIVEDEAVLRRRIDATVTADWQWKTEPRNLTGSATHDSVTLSWNESKRPSQVIGYQVLRREDAGTEFVLLAELQANAVEMTYEDRSGVAPGTSYTYRILSQYPEIGRLIADDGSDEVTVKTLPSGTDATSTATPTP